MSDQLEPGTDSATPAVGTSNLPLRGAIFAWCDPALVAVVRKEEIRLTEHQYRGTGLPLLSGWSALAEPQAYDWMGGQLSYTALRAGWDRLLRDLRKRIEQRELFLRGVRLAPVFERTLERWRWLKTGPAYIKVGGRVVYALTDVEAYEAAQRHQAAS